MLHFSEKWNFYSGSIADGVKTHLKAGFILILEKQQKSRNPMGLTLFSFARNIY